MAFRVRANQWFFTWIGRSEGTRFTLVRRYCLRCRLTQELTRPPLSDWTDLRFDWQILMTTIKTKTSLHSRWVVLGALAFMMCVSMALPIYGGSVLGTYMTAELHWERSTLGLLIAANMAANGLCAPLVAALTTKIGVRWCLIIGCLFMAAASIALATWVTEPWQAVVTFGAIGVAATFASVIPCQTAVAAWFTHRRPFALSLLYAAMGIGGFIFVWLMTWAIQGSTIGYRMGCWVFFGFRPGGHPAVGAQQA